MEARRRRMQEALYWAVEVGDDQLAEKLLQKLRRLDAHAATSKAAGRPLDGFEREDLRAMID